MAQRGKVITIFSGNPGTQKFVHLRNYPLFFPTDILYIYIHILYIYVSLYHMHHCSTGQFCHGSSFAAGAVYFSTTGWNYCGSWAHFEGAVCSTGRWFKSNKQDTSGAENHGLQAQKDSLGKAFPSGSWSRMFAKKNKSIFSIPRTIGWDAPRNGFPTSHMQRSVPQRRSVATPALALRRVADPSGQADDEDVGSADAWARYRRYSSRDPGWWSQTEEHSRSAQPKLFWSPKCTAIQDRWHSAGSIFIIST